MSVYTPHEIDIFGRMQCAVDILEACTPFASLIPEVRTNIVYAAPQPSSPQDVCAIDGRITTRNGSPSAAGKPRFGASSHMARLILEINKKNPAIRAGIDFAAFPALIEWLKHYCEREGLTFSKIDRSKEPESCRDTEGASMPWKVAEAIRAAGNTTPDIFYETGIAGKEEVSVVVGTEPIALAQRVCAIAHEFSRAHEKPSKVGKIDLDTFNSFVLSRLGKKDPSVIVPPLTGVDAAVIDIGNDRVLITAQDPIFYMPRLSPEMFGWYTVHIGASDVAVMGVKPRYMTYSLLMPPETGDDVFRRIVDSIHTTAEELDIAIVGGHTGHYPGIAAPTIGGISVFSHAASDAYVTPGGARPGNDIILTKGPAVEAVGILAWLREEELLQHCSRDIVDNAKARASDMSVVRDAMIAMHSGGVTAMHDATEGGVIGGLFEIANASAVGMEVDEASFVYPEEIRAVCEVFDIDPAAAIAEGALLITADKNRSSAIVEALGHDGIPASVIGSVTDDPALRRFTRLNGETVPLAIPEQDPFWPVFFEGIGS